LRLIAYNTCRVIKLEFVILIWFLQGQRNGIMPYDHHILCYLYYEGAVEAGLIKRR